MEKETFEFHLFDPAGDKTTSKVEDIKEGLLNFVGFPFYSLSVVCVDEPPAGRQYSGIAALEVPLKNSSFLKAYNR